MPLNHLLADGRIRRARTAPEAAARVATLATGWPALDAALPGGGWPRGVVVEILAPRAGIGELGLVLPALAALARQRRDVFWIAPPWIPYPPALAARGLDPARCLWVEARGDDALWAAEQALADEACGAALVWTEHADPRRVQRLQRAAGRHGSLCFLHPPSGGVSTSAPLRLRLEPGPEGALAVRILRCRGAPPGRTVLLERTGALA